MWNYSHERFTTNSWATLLQATLKDSFKDSLWWLARQQRVSNREPGLIARMWGVEPRGRRPSLKRPPQHNGQITTVKHPHALGKENKAFNLPHPLGLAKVHIVLILFKSVSYIFNHCYLKLVQQALPWVERTQTFSQRKCVNHVFVGWGV